jgi:hypothetical protein
MIMTRWSEKDNLGGAHLSFRAERAPFTQPRRPPGHDPTAVIDVDEPSDVRRLWSCLAIDRLDAGL